MIFLILLLIFQFNYSIQVYAVNETCYARVLFDQVYFYKSANDDNSIENIYFELPKTYFVELVGKEKDLYKARYMDFYGYVKKDCVQAVANTPNNPFLTNINFRVYSNLSETMWTSPKTQDSTQLITIPHLTKNITFIGQINGECLIENRTNIWYFCKYTDSSDHYGYIYSDFCDQMSEITPNNENIDFVSNPTFETILPPQNTIPQNSNFVGIVVIILSVPVLIFLFMVIKGSKILTGSKTSKKEVVDY